jgi:cytochrome c-type biogenesis protein CcmF
VPTLLKMAIVPAAVGLAAGAGAAIVFGVTGLMPLLTVILIFFAFTALAGEFWRGAVARRQSSGEMLPVALLSAMNRNRRRYGGYIVHIGIFVIYLGILGSSLYKTEADHRVSPGESFKAGRYTILYKGLQIDRLPDYLTLKGVVEVSEGEKKIGYMFPERRFYFHWEQPSAEPAVYPTLRDDLYMILSDPSVGKENLGRIKTGFYEDQWASFKVAIEPLINWIWIGCTIAVIGGTWALLPRRRREDQ